MCSKCRVGDRMACALRPEHGCLNTDHFLNKHTGWLHTSQRVQEGTLPVGKSSPLAGSRCSSVQTSG